MQNAGKLHQKTFLVIRVNHSQSHNYDFAADGGLKLEVLLLSSLPVFPLGLWGQIKLEIKRHTSRSFITFLHQKCFNWVAC